jgi:DNA-binding NarL/FixJ family response regulator
VIRVLLADDQALIRDSFRLLLELEPDLEMIGEASNGQEAVALTRQPRPDVVLMDIRMPLLDGIAATRAMTRTGLPAAVLILTTYDADDYLYDAMKAGASGSCSRTSAVLSSPRRSGRWPRATRCFIPHSPADCSSASSPARPPAGSRPRCLP